MILGRRRARTEHKAIGTEYNDALDAIRSGKLGLMNPLVWFILAPAPQERQSRQL